MSLPATSRVFGLDLLRASAIAMVVAAHGFPFLYPVASKLGYLGHGGFYGVELFFVLSGYLIGSILLGRGEKLGQAANVFDFWKRRWWRTLPNYYLFLAVNVLLAVFLTGAVVPWERWPRYLFFLNNLTGLHPGFYGEVWSLAVEEWFYFIFPILLWLGLKVSRNFDRVFLITTATLLLAPLFARFAVMGDPAMDWSSHARMIVAYRFDAIMTGVLCAWLHRKFPETWARHRSWLAATGVILLLGLYVTLFTHDGNNQTYFAKTLRFSLVSLGFAMLLPWASLRQPARESRTTWAVRAVALWSYSLYLCHLPVEHMVVRFFPPATPADPGRAVLAFGIYLAGALAVSAVVYRVYERPMMQMRDR